MEPIDDDDLFNAEDTDDESRDATDTDPRTDDERIADDIELVDKKRSDLGNPLDVLIAKEANMEKDINITALGAALLTAKDKAIADKKIKRANAALLRAQAGIKQPAPPIIEPLKDATLSNAPLGPINTTPIAEHAAQPIIAKEQVLFGQTTQLPTKEADPVEPDVAKGLATKEYIDHAGDAQADAMDQDKNEGKPATRPMILINPMIYLKKLRPFGNDGIIEYLGANAICTSIGYAVISDMLMELRNARKVQPDAHAQDVFSHYQDLFDQEQDDAHTKELGYTPLPVFHGASLKAVYMWMLYRQRAHRQLGPKYPPTLPTEIIRAIQTGDRGAELEAAYSSVYINALGLNNPALLNILQAKEQVRQQRSERDEAINTADKAAVLDELTHTRPEPLTDEIWYELPLYVQYRYSAMLYRRIQNSIAQEMSSRVRSTNHLREMNLTTLEELGKMIHTLHLELEAADRTAEVKAAFAQGRLDDRHDIHTHVAAPAAPTPKMQRAPKEAQDDDEENKG